MTMPSARPPASAVIGQDGVGDDRRRRIAATSSIIVSTPFAASTSKALASAGSDSAWVSMPMNSGPSVPWLRR